MRLIYSIFIFFCFSSLWSQNKETQLKDIFNYKVTYLLTYQIDSTDSHNIKKDEMVLYIGDKSSRFSSRGKAIGDSLMDNADRNNKSQAEFARIKAQIPPTDFDYYIFKGIPKNKISFTRKLVKNNLRYVEDLSDLHWEIKDSIKNIHGYHTQLAVTHYAGRNYKAWFTSEVPISEGPYKFSGLPGLILKISDSEKEYVFELQKLEKLENGIPFTFDPEYYITTSKEKVVQVKEEYDADPIAALERIGMSFTFPPGERQKMDRENKELMKHQNNPIELE